MLHPSKQGSDGIYEVHPRIFQSGYVLARNPRQLATHGITHILVCTPDSGAPHYPERISYHVLDKIEDSLDSKILRWLPEGIQFINNALK